jgi:hypothetical protein
MFPARMTRKQSVTICFNMIQKTEIIFKRLGYIVIYSWINQH